MLSERRYDKTVEDSFPASDAPANSGIVGPEEDQKPNDKPITDERPTGSPTPDRYETETRNQDKSDPRP